MSKKEKELRDVTADNLEQILCSMRDEENRHQELIFPEGVIEKLCREKQYPCYKYAHNLEGHIYMRVRTYHITFEYLVVSYPGDMNLKESIITQIMVNGQIIYHRPNNPDGTIYVCIA